MSRRERPIPILLEWFNVTYRSVFVGLAVVAGLALAGAGYWYYEHRYRPRREAQASIASAGERYAEAQAHEGNTQLRELIERAGVALESARASFAGGQYPEAQEHALRSESLSQRVLDMAAEERGERTTQVRIFRVEGDVRVKRAGEFAWVPAERNLLLRAGDQIKTSASASAQLLYFDGTVTTVQPGSLVEIRELYEHPVTRVRRVRERLNWGEVLASTQQGNVRGSYHEVGTEQAAARTERESEFRVAYDRETRRAAFDVFGGMVEVASDSERQVLEGGERVEADASGRLQAKELLPDVPRLIAPPDQRVFVFERSEQARIRLTWERVPGAVRYRLMIADRFLFSEPLYDAQREDTEVVIEGIAPGEYYWKVAAVNDAAIEGRFSETRQFRVTNQRIRDAADRTPPALEITEVVQSGPMLIVNGRTEPGAQVWVDNERVEVADDGTFYTVVRLRKEGLNELVFVAQDAAGNQTTRRHRAYVETY